MSLFSKPLHYCRYGFASSDTTEKMSVYVRADLLKPVIRTKPHTPSHPNEWEYSLQPPRNAILCWSVASLIELHISLLQGVQELIPSKCGPST